MLLLGLQALPSFAINSSTLTDRTIGGAAFKVIGTAFAGSLKYKQHKKSKGKAYGAIFSCRLSRAVQLELMSSMETSHFITSFKCLIACHGIQPTEVYQANID